MDTTKNENNFDVDAWIKLYREDPKGFDRKRLELIENSISEAPEHLQQRLRGLQFKIDAQRKISANPMAATLKLSQLMWKELGNLRDALEGNISENTPLDATVLPFNKSETRE